MKELHKHGTFIHIVYVERYIIKFVKHKTLNSIVLYITNSLSKDYSLHLFLS